MEDILKLILDALSGAGAPAAIAAAIFAGFVYLKSAIVKKLDEIVERTSTKFDDEVWGELKKKLGIE